MRHARSSSGIGASSSGATSSSSAGTRPASRRLPRGETEIIEIGAVLVDATTLEPVDEHQTFLRPVRHPRLTPFCTRLTRIRQEDVDGAPLFPEAIRNLGAWLHGRRALFSSWGDYDKNQLGREAAHHRLRLPFGQAHLNVKRRFSEVLDDPKRYGMGEALRRVGLPLVGTHHRGIDDARNIARLLRWIVEHEARA